MKRLKVIVNAYACSPYRGSEPGVGWGFVHALAQNHDLWVIVEEEKFRQDIERYLADNPTFQQNVRFHFIAKRRHRRLRKLWPPSYYWFYEEWQHKALELARALHADVGFDLAHQLTMVGFREPGYLWQLGIPFVWGPIGGMGYFPWRFIGEVGAWSAVHYSGYNFYNFVQTRWLRRPAEAAARAGDGLIAATRENLEGAAKYWGAQGVLLSEVGLPCPPIKQPTVRSRTEPLRLVWSGLHIARKALPLGLKGLARVHRDVKWTLDVLGTGPETSRWQAFAVRSGVASRVRFHGWLERARALEIMGEAHAMLITSLRDLTASVTIEALALGLPVICLDHCGFADVIDEDCGIRIPVDSPARVSEGIAHAIERLAADEGYRRQLANGAITRAKDFEWQRKASVVDGIYRRVITK